MRSLTAFPALAASLLACATTQPEAAAPPVEEEGQPLQASGEILFLTAGGTGTSAAFDDRRIMGPSVNLTLGSEGTWDGDLSGQNVSLAITSDRITGAGVDLHVERQGEVTSLRGGWFQRRVSLEFTPKNVTGRAGPACSVDVERKAPGVYQGSVGCVVRAPPLPGGTISVAGPIFPDDSILPSQISPARQQLVTNRATLRLAGDAASPNPPMPQFALALLAVLPP